MTVVQYQRRGAKWKHTEELGYAIFSFNFKLKIAK